MNRFEYLVSNGLAIIRVKPKSKEPFDKRWQQRTSADNDLAEFAPDDNVGIVLGDASGGIVDIDLDSDYARRAGPLLLPKTNAKFGRVGAPSSHCLYRVANPGKTEQRRVRGEMSVEYRANGAMTVVPPSIHKETGETIGWNEAGTIATATRDELIAAINRIAAIDLIAPHYVAGSRHNFVLALVGTLVGWQQTEDDIAHFVHALCAVTSDEEEKDRLAAIQTTIGKARNGDAYAGKTAFEQIVGAEVMKAFRKFWNATERQAQPLAAPAPSTQHGLISAEIDKNDTGVAIEFAKQLKGRIAYVDEQRCFYVYNDGLWRPDPNGVLVTGLLTTFIRDWSKDVRDSSVDHAQVAAQLRFLIKYQNSNNIANALKQSRALLAVPYRTFDADDNILSVNNGVICLKTGALRDPSPEHYVTRRAEVDYDPQATCPIFMNFMDRIFANDADVIEYMQVVLGYCLTGMIDRQEFYIFHGQGTNGKSTLTNIIERILGSYCGILLPEALFEGGGSANVDLATMAGKRLGIASEAESNKRLNCAQIKRLTGNSTVKVRELYRGTFEMPVKFKIIIACNKTPAFDGNDGALKRRVKVIPFDVIIPDGKQDRQLPSKLWAERQGILAWLVQGAIKYHQGDWRVPQAVLRATRGVNAGVILHQLSES